MMIGHMATDWFTRGDLRRRLITQSQIVASNFVVELGVTAHDLSYREPGYCQASRRYIWVHPLALYHFAAAPQPVFEAMTGLDHELRAYREAEDWLGVRLSMARFYWNDPMEESHKQQRRARTAARRKLRVTARDEFVFAQYVTMHERLHERFSDGFRTRDELRHQVWNFLEDERIERLGSKLWRKVRFFLLRGNQLAYRLALQSWLDSYDRGDVVTPVLNSWLHLRFGFRAGELKDVEDVRSKLKEPARELFDKTWPLVQQAWDAPSSDEVLRLAKEIIELLPKNEVRSRKAIPIQCTLPEDMFDPNPGAEDMSPLEAPEAPRFIEDEEEGEDFSDEEEELDKQKSFGPDDGAAKYWSVPASYLDILADPEVAEGVHRLREAFKVPSAEEQRRHAEPNQFRGRLDARYYRRNPDKPFRRQSPPVPVPGKLYLQLMFDLSGSMGFGQGSSIHMVRILSVLFAEALAEHPLVDWEMRSMPQDILLGKKGDDHEKLLGQLAGLLCPFGTEYGRPMQQASERIKKHDSPTSVILAIVDGEMSHQDQLTVAAVSKGLREEGHFVKAVGIKGDSNLKRIGQAFGEDHFSAIKGARQLVEKMEELLVSIGERHFHQIYS